MTLSSTVDEAPGSTQPALIEVRSVSKTFGSTKALTDVSLSVAPGRTHALVGRNGAGKSTLVSVMTGLVEPDEGSVWFSGEPAPSTRTPGRWQEEVACVYQHRRIVPHLSVAENLLLNRMPRSGFRVDWGQAYRRAGDLLAEWNIDLDPKMSAARLGVEDAQLVEIVRALSGGSRFVILDEPTAQLVASGVRRLFRELTRLQDAGVTFLYISHHLEEIEELCQDVTVLRNGRVVGSDTVANMPTTRIVESMVGGTGGTSRRTERRTRGEDAAAGTAPVLSVRDLECEGLVEPFSVDVRPGEVVGLAGHAGSSRSARARRGRSRATAWRSRPRTRATRCGPASATCPRTGTPPATCRCCPSRTTSRPASTAGWVAGAWSPGSSAAVWPRS
jgi:simple sugar transport system ATP-binding protein